MYLLGTTTEFQNLVELVNYYKKKPLYRKIKLRYPVTPELVERFSTVSVFRRQSSAAASPPPVYFPLTLCPLCFTQEKNCGALYDVKTYVEPNEIEPALVCTQLLFTAHYCITTVLRVDGDPINH